jgi:aryl-alcohol dehydrogenase-like predicted oxidoreductase
MALRPLGRTGLIVSPIGLGTVKIGRNTGVRYPKPFSLPTTDHVTALLERALELGVNLFDTAPAYGTSESRMAGFVARHRDEIVLSTKVGEEFDGDTSTHHFRRAAIIASVERSLTRLGVDSVDLLLLHSDGRDMRVLTQTDAVETVLKLKEQGKARAVGISAKTSEGIEEAARHLDVVMAPFSRSLQDLAPALATAHALGVGVLAIKGLGSGQLAAIDPTAEDDRPRSRVPVTYAVRFVVGQPFVDSLVVGTLSPVHLEEITLAAGMEVRS